MSVKLMFSRSLWAKIKPPLKMANFLKLTSPGKTVTNLRIVSNEIRVNIKIYISEIIVVI